MQSRAALETRIGLIHTARSRTREIGSIRPTKPNEWVLHRVTANERAANSAGESPRDAPFALRTLAPSHDEVCEGYPPRKVSRKCDPGRHLSS